MLQFLIAALMLGGAQAFQDWYLPTYYGLNLDFATTEFIITDEWKELPRDTTDRDEWVPTSVPMATLDEGWLMNRGLLLKIKTYNVLDKNIRFLAFHGEGVGMAAEYLGYLAWYAEGIRIQDSTAELLCDVEISNDNVFSPDGEWLFMADEEGYLTVTYSNPVFNVDPFTLATIDISECGLPWMSRAKQVGFGGFSDLTTEMYDKVKYANPYTPEPDTDDDDEADDDNEDETETADMCQRGQFYWMEKCHDCPPGHSTVRQGNTDFNDCIESRYISCQMHTEEGDMEREVMECERVLCPCNEAYEECDWNTHSQDYGKCKQSQYISSARGVAGATTLVVMVTTLFSL